jgi:hypothetical protein
MRLLICSIAAAGLIAGGSVAMAAPGSADSHDGRWSVRLVTQSGGCDPSYRYTVTIDDGRVSYAPQAGEAPAAVSGQVAPGGAVSLGIRKGLAQASAAGRLRGKIGAGTWEVGLLGCTGRWTAQRTA